MAPKSQNGFGVFFLVFFFGGEGVVLLGVLQKWVYFVWFLDGKSW
jgi:hypothetical protein